MAAKYGGFFLKGLAGGLQTGLNLGIQLQEMKWQKKERERLQKEKDEITESVSAFNKRVKDCYADGTVSDDERLQITTMYLSSAYEVKEKIDSTYKAIQEGHRDIVEQNFKWFSLYKDQLGDADPSDMPALFEFARSQMQGEKAIQTFTAYDNMLKKTYEARQEVEKPSIGDYGTGLTYLKNIINVSPENWERSKKGLENKFGFDYSAITQESLREVGSEAYNLYNTPEEVMASVKAPAGLTIVPERDTKTGKYYAKFSKEAVPTPTPEGEITAGEKRTYDMASSIMFGSSDWVTGISKPGIISTKISNKLNMGQALTDEEKTEVRSNYNTIKGTLPGEVISAVESQLKRYGIPLEEPIKEPTPTPEPEPKKWWEFWKGETPTGTPTKTTPTKPEVTPTAGEIPPMKVPTAEKEALIPLMSKKELEEAIKGLDPSGPLYKLIYDEAVKRGYITK